MSNNNKRNVERKFIAHEPNLPDTIEFPEVGKMVIVPGGKFLMGTTEDEIEKALWNFSQFVDEKLIDRGTLRQIFKNETPQFVVDLPPFYISEQPITLEHWWNFVEEGGYQKREYWRKEDWDELQKELVIQAQKINDTIESIKTQLGSPFVEDKVRLQEELRRAENLLPFIETKYRLSRRSILLNIPSRFPFGFVPNPQEDNLIYKLMTWDESYAFTKWLDDKIVSKYDGNLEFSLPFESEWEKAMRGTDGRIYPWGDEWAGVFGIKHNAGGWPQFYVESGGFDSITSPYGLKGVFTFPSGKAIGPHIERWTTGELTASELREYPYRSRDMVVGLEHQVKRVVRGAGNSRRERGDVMGESGSVLGKTTMVEDGVFEEYLHAPTQILVCRCAGERRTVFDAEGTKPTTQSLNMRVVTRNMEVVKKIFG